MIGLIDSVMSAIGAKLGMAADPLKLVLTLVLSYPFCAVLKRLPDGNKVYKQIFCVAVSGFYLLGIFSLKYGLRTLMISSLGTYAIAKYMKSTLMPWAAFVFVMGHLTISHIGRYKHPESDGVVDITGAQMVLVMKLTAFAWNVHDGRRPVAELSKIQIDRALTTLPPLFDFLTYVFFFPSLLIGPSFDYAEFSRWLDLSMFDPEQKVTAKRHKKSKRKIPRSGRVAFRKALQGFFWIALFVYLGSVFQTSYIFSPEYLHHSFLFRIFYLWPLGFTYRLKYYGAWSLAEGACILCGLSYNGIDAKSGKRSWDRVKNIDWYKFESGQNTYTLLEAWNMNTNKWLKTYVYLRVTPRGKKPGFRSTLLTFLTSALWHGVSPGYYLTFMTGAFMQSCGRSIRRYIRPFFLTADQAGPGPYKKYYDAVTYVCTQLVFGYAVQPFMILTFRESIKAWRGVYFYIHIALFSMTFLFSRREFRKFVESKLAARNTAASKLSQLRYDIERARAKKLQSELEQLDDGSSPSLGIPDHDFDQVQTEIKEEMQLDLAVLKNDLDQFRRRATAATRTDTDRKQ
ncbi:MBOAT, membrane-bound O-acyltransferase family-domain-containing protein [Lipomyces arxii]|uniref:MBOAT, membrane-bound O-acyltransferase family-domain-containing protein n=1 Tax=Lipomyces arxii TaxID=56418 RepID=UPI0034CF06B4